MSNETNLVNQVIDRFQAEGGWWFKVHGSPMQMMGVPDVIGCWQGRFIAIELKMPDNTASAIQKHVIKLLKKSGARVGVARSVEEALLIRDIRGTVDTV